MWPSPQCWKLWRPNSFNNSSTYNEMKNILCVPWKFQIQNHNLQFRFSFQLPVDTVDRSPPRVHVWAIMANGPRTLKLFKLNIINFISKSRQAVFIILKFNSLPMFRTVWSGIINNKYWFTILSRETMGIMWGAEIWDMRHERMVGTWGWCRVTLQEAGDLIVNTPIASAGSALRSRSSHLPRPI